MGISERLNEIPALPHHETQLNCLQVDYCIATRKSIQKEMITFKTRMNLSRYGAKWQYLTLLRLSILLINSLYIMR